MRLDQVGGVAERRSAGDALAPGTGQAYLGPEVTALLEGPGEVRREVPAARQIFVNRNLRMDKVELIGFDMDYTLAIYHLRELEELAFRMTAARMVEHLGYPEELRALRYDPEFVIRGLVVDKVTGNIFKMDRHNHVRARLPRPPGRSPPRR